MEPENLSMRERRFYEEAVKIVEQHLPERSFNVSELCAYLGISRVTLHRKMKAILNQSASEFIRTLRLARAAQLIKEGEYNIHQTAERTGFFNQSYFSKCFKEEYHCLPSKFIQH